MRAPQPEQGRPEPVGRCVRCGQAVYLRAAGGRFLEARGVCNFCYQGARKRGLLIDLERHSRARDEVMAEWELLRSEGYSKRQAAERLGMKFKTFAKAYERARRDGDPRAVPGLSFVAGRAA